MGHSTHKTTCTVLQLSPSCCKNRLLMVQLRSLSRERVKRPQDMFIYKGRPTSMCSLLYQGHMCSQINNSHVQRHREKMIPCVTLSKGHLRPGAGLDGALVETTLQHRFSIFSAMFPSFLYGCCLNRLPNL